MYFCVLGSGSKGNCTYVASGETALLIDAGFSGIEIERRLAQIGVDFSKIKAVLVTHAHGDHVHGVSVLSRRFHLPVWVNSGTKEAAGKYLEKLHAVEYFETGTTFRLGDLDVHPFAISHDCVDPVGYTINDGSATLGYCTDTGMVSKLIHHHLSSCQGLVLECNHDLTMLKNGHYPIHVQQRVRSKNGHLANHQTIEFLKDLYCEGLQKVVLAHISESNNSIAVIKESVRKLLNDLELKSDLLNCSVQISLASQTEVGELVVLH